MIAGDVESHAFVSAVLVAMSWRKRQKKEKEKNIYSTKEIIWAVRL